MHAIETHDLTKTYRSSFARKAIPSLSSLSLTVAENEVFGFLGKNGAGKTTTIKILCGLIRPTRGNATLFGINIRERRSRGLIGYLPENPYFYEYLTPRETIDFYGRLGGLDKKSRALEWERLSEMLDLREIADQRVRAFSKGMRQRLGFAVALVGDPRLLILDEPMSGLDPAGRRRIRELILYLRDQRKTVFFSSHILGDVEQICDRVGILSKGHLRVQGRINELLTRKVNQVEVVASGLSEAVVTEISYRSIRTRLSEDGHHFYLADIDLANEMVRRIHESGGTLVDFTPVKETLEDYFLREETMNYFRRPSPAPQQRVMS